MNWSYRFGWLFFRTFFALYSRARFLDAKHVPAQGPVILASNHASFLDPALVGSGFNRMVNYLARDTLFDAPILGSLLRSWKVVPVDREGGGGAGLKAILDRLRNGGIILLFPEGTRTRDGSLGSAKSGIGLAVIKSTAPVVPVRVFGTFEAYGRHLSWPRPRRLTVRYGAPMDFKALRAEAQECPKQRLKEIYQQVSDQIMAEIVKLKAETSNQ